MKDERGTGRTTAIMLRVLSQASHCPGMWIPFEDHYPDWKKRAKWYARMLGDLVEGTGLVYQVKFEPRDNSVHVMFPIHLLRQGKIDAKS